MLASDLIASVKRRASVPSTQGLVTSAEILTIADEETLSYIAPLIRDAREDYLLAKADAPIDAGVLSYIIPDRAMGNTLREVAVINPQGYLQNLPRVDYGDLADTSVGFALDGGYVFLSTDTPSQLSGTLRMTYYQRPSRLVLETAVATVVSFDTATNAITLSGTPAGFTSSAAYDLVRSTSPFFTYATNQEPTSLVGSLLTLSTPLPDDLRVGDYVTLAETTCVPMMPTDLHPLLAQAVTVKVLQAIGDAEMLDRSMGVLGQMEKSARGLIAQRVEGEPKKVVNRRSLFRTSW